MMSEVQLNQFTFFRSYADCARYLPEQEQLAFFWALFDYGLDGAEPEQLAGAAKGLFVAVQPNISSSRNKAIVKLKKNSPEQGENNLEQGENNLEQDENKLEQDENDKEKEKEKEKEREGERSEYGARGQFPCRV